MDGELTNEVARAMLKWLGGLPWAGEFTARNYVAEAEDRPTPGNDSILWHVAERLEREGWSVDPHEPGEDTPWFMSYMDTEGKTRGIGPFPTKSAAVIAAWKHETGAKDGK